MSILVCGGAGYIGSHAVAALLRKQESVIVIDNLQTGHKEAVLDGAKFYEGDIRDEKFLESVFEKETIDAVMHFAADSLVGESMENPIKYYENNVYGAMKLLKVMNKFEVKNIVFSSTAATYGEPNVMPIEEVTPTTPTNPYGETKLAVENMLLWVEKAYGIKHVIFRYFNVAGADISGLLGEDHNPETHLIPIILQVALGKREFINIFGDDYPTPDGTCIRDYVHVMDLVDAHILGLEKLRQTGQSEIYNLGNGNGFSVKEVIEAVRKVTAQPIPSKITKRREGDPAQLIASSQKAIDKLRWRPKYSSLESMIESAWEWYKKHPEGY